MHKNVCRGARGHLQAMGLGREESKRVILSSGLWSPKSEGWPRKDRYEKIDKHGKNCMHWNVAPDAIPGSARPVRVLDGWLNN